MTASLNARNAAAVLVVAGLLLLPLYTSLSGNVFALTLFTRIVIFALAASSLNLIMGYGGMMSFGHAAYLGIGGYAVGILAAEGIGSGFVQWPVAMLASALFALVISLLFSLFNAFQRREAAVVALDAIAGAPSTGLQLLETCAKDDLAPELAVTFDQWRMWSVDVLETHLTYPLLFFFRSSHDNEAWANSFGAVMDAAVLVISTIDGGPVGHAMLMHKVGSHLVADMRHYYYRGVHGELPGVEHEEFLAACDRLERAGYRLHDRETAWEKFSTLRGKYAPWLNEMTKGLAIPPAPWIGDRSYLPHRDRVLDLLQHEGGKHRQYLQRDAVVVFVEPLQQRGVGEPVLAFRAQLLLGVFRILLRLAVDGGIADVMAAALVHDDGALLRQLVQFERREEQVQDAGMVGVLDVLHVELPVVRQRLRDAADHDRGSPTQHALDPGCDFLAEIFLERGHVFRERSEDQAVQGGNAQLARAMRLHPEALGHAALSLHAILERHALQVALPVVGPCVIDAAEILLALAVVVQTDQCAAMRAAVLEGIDLSVAVAGDDDGRIANRGGAEIAWLRQLHFKREVVPARPLKNQLLLGLVGLVGLEHPVGYPRQSGLPGGQPWRRHTVLPRWRSPAAASAGE